MIDASEIFSSPLIADGSPHHWLLHGDPGVAAGEMRSPGGGQTPPCAWNLEHPEVVERAHRAYREAGARLLRTNTQGAERITLAGHGLAERAEAINNSGAALVQSAGGTDAFKMGVIGQIPSGRGGLIADPDARARAYSEQVVFLSDTGVTFFLLEHFDSLTEALLVLRLAERASDAPVLAQMQFSPGAGSSGGETNEGTDAITAAKALVDHGAGALGIGCMSGLEQIHTLVEQLLPCGVPLSVMPGFPGGLTPWTPGEFATRVAPLTRLGVRIVGGCCGVSPEHIHGLAEALRAP